MLKFNQLQAYDEAKKFLLYAETMVNRYIDDKDEITAHKLKGSLLTFVSDIARIASAENDEQRREEVIQAAALLHEIAAGFDIAKEKKLITEELYEKLATKVKDLLDLLAAYK
ncbi:MAG TPA: hypothetical protein PKL83_05555 [bacterium]|nr:hypothetical protein [bacterium]